MRPRRADVLAAVLAEPGGISTRQLAEKLATVPYQIQANLSKLAADGQITRTVTSPRGDAVWRPISKPAISLGLPVSSSPTLEFLPWRSSAKFVAYQNVTHFRSELENGAEGGRRAVLLKLLVEEEDKLGLTREQLGEVDQQIARIKGIVAQQTDAVAMLKANGHPMERAERTLSNLVALLATHEAYRQKIEAALVGKRD
jgi:hypothetical protein